MLPQILQKWKEWSISDEFMFFFKKKQKILLWNSRWVCREVQFCDRKLVPGTNILLQWTWVGREVLCFHGVCDRVLVLFGFVVRKEGGGEESLKIAEDSIKVVSFFWLEKCKAKYHPWIIELISLALKISLSYTRKKKSKGLLSLLLFIYFRNFDSPKIWLFAIFLFVIRSSRITLKANPKVKAHAIF